MDTSFGVSSKVASTKECPSGIPTSKNNFCELRVYEVTLVIVKTASVVLTEAVV